MSRQDKATTEKFTRTLRELVKQPENKVCADCKRNDPRWASWNLGVFLCIRCSGIHRGMGTHISKVKSVDLDTWTPEQMESIQKWGNHLANLYWEAHLKKGHLPPDHKMEAFIRSKYESRRWALEGPPPSDPSILEDGTTQPPPADHTPTPPPVTLPIPNASTFNRLTTKQTPQLISATYTTQQRSDKPEPIQAVPAAPANPPSVANDLFSLDFHAPPSTSATGSASPQLTKDVKQDILSLFSAPPPAPAANPVAFGQPAAPSPWGATQPAPTSMVGATGVGAWGASSGWGGSTTTNAAGSLWGNPAPAQSNSLWGSSPNQQSNIFASSNDIWGGSSAPNPSGHSLVPSSASNTVAQPKKDDVFGDIWGSFK